MNSFTVKLKKIKSAVGVRLGRVGATVWSIFSTMRKPRRDKIHRKPRNFSLDRAQSWDLNIESGTKIIQEITLIEVETKDGTRILMKKRDNIFERIVVLPKGDQGELLEVLNNRPRIFVPRGGELISPEMVEWLMSTRKLVRPYATRVILMVLHARGYTKLGNLIDFTSFLMTASGFSIGPQGPINRVDQLDRLVIPPNQSDTTPIRIMRPDLLNTVFEYSVSQVSKKQKHYMGEYASGERRIVGQIKFLANRTMDVENTQIYTGITFDEKYKQPLEALVALFRNETHNFGMVYVIEKEGNRVRAIFRTAYNFSMRQLEKLIEQRKVQ